MQIEIVIFGYSAFHGIYNARWIDEIIASDWHLNGDVLVPQLSLLREFLSCFYIV